jgi:hypothetical protein
VFDAAAKITRPADRSLSNLPSPAEALPTPPIKPSMGGATDFASAVRESPIDPAASGLGQLLRQPPEAGTSDAAMARAPVMGDKRAPYNRALPAGLGRLMPARQRLAATPAQPLAPPAMAAPATSTGQILQQLR